MIINIKHTPLRSFSSIENYVKQFKNPYNLRPNQVGYHLLSPDLLYADGWRDVVIPTIGENQRRGELFYDDSNDVVTYQVIDLTPEEIDTKNKASVPFSITPTQGRLLLHRMKLLSGVKNALKNSIDEEMNIYWEHALSWYRDNSYIKAMAVQLGMSDIDLDNFFIEAAKIS